MNCKGKLKCLFVTSYALLCFVTCSEGGKNDQPFDYALYLGLDDLGLIYVLDLEDFSVIDSLQYDTITSSIVVSAESQSLFVQGGGWEGPIGITRFDLVTGAETGFLEGGGHYGFDPIGNGAYVAWQGDSCQSIVDLERFEIAYTLDDSLCILGGNRAATQIAVLPVSSNRIRILDFVSGQLVGEVTPIAYPGFNLRAESAEIHPNGKWLLLIGRHNQNPVPYFLVVEIATGRTLLQHPLRTLIGSIAISNDGRLAAASDPGTLGFDYINLWLDVFDLTTMRHVRRFGTAYGDSTVIQFHKIVFLPDDTKMVVAPYFHFSESPLLVVDLATLQIERSLQFGESRKGALAIGRRF